MRRRSPIGRAISVMELSTQRLLEIGDKVYSRFDANADAKEPIRHTGTCPLLRVHVRVRRETRLRDERIDAAEARCMAEQLQLPQKTLGGARSPCELERHHTTEPIKKRARDFMIGVRR